MRFNRITAILFAFLIMVSASLTTVFADGVPTEADSVRVSEKMPAKSYRTTTGWDLNYRLYRSSGYDSTVDIKPAILIFYLHNESGKGDDNLTHLAERGLLNQLVSDSADLLFLKYQYIVVAPQCPEGKSFTDEDMLSAINELKGEINATEIITSQCIVMGVGTGADGAFAYASRYTQSVSRLVAVGGTPDKLKAFGALSSGVTMMYFAESGNTAARDFYDYAESMGEGGFLTAVFTEGNLAQSVSAALKYNDPSVTEWAVKDAYESRYFDINARCTDGGGKISVSPDKVRYGGNATVLLTVNKGYAIERVVVDGEDVDVSELEQSKSNKNQYTYNFMGVTLDHSIMVELAAIPTSGDKEGLISGLITYLTVASVALILTAAIVLTLSVMKKRKG